MDMRMFRLTFEGKSVFFYCLMDLHQLDSVLTLDKHYPFSAREVALEYPRPDGQGIYMKRHLTFQSVEQLFAEIDRTRPIGVHLGCLRLATNRQQLIREVVFDIDVTDKAEYCACECNVAKPPRACSKCWLFMQISLHCLVTSLKLIFKEAELGRHILVMFSGNRGMHVYLTWRSCWKYSSQDRSQLVRAISFIADAPLSPVQHMMEPPIRDFYKQRLYPVHASALAAKEVSAEPDLATLVKVCWPRLDVRVTTDPNHLIRCPNTTNPKSGAPVTLLSPHEDLLGYVPPLILAREEPSGLRSDMVGD